MTTSQFQPFFDQIRDIVLFLDHGAASKFNALSKSLCDDAQQPFSKAPPNNARRQILIERYNHLVQILNDVEKSIETLKKEFKILLVAENELSFDDMQKLKQSHRVYELYTEFKRSVDISKQYQMLKNQINDLVKKIMLFQILLLSGIDQLAGIFWNNFSYESTFKSDVPVPENWPQLYFCFVRIHELIQGLRQEANERRTLSQEEFHFLYQKLLGCSRVLFNSRNERKPGKTRSESVPLEVLMKPSENYQIEPSSRNPPQLLAQEYLTKLLRLPFFSVTLCSVNGDGNCFFRAVVRSLFPLCSPDLENRLSVWLRYKINSGDVNKDRKHPLYDFIEPDINDSRVMQHPGVWADHLQVVKTSIFLDIPLWLVRCDDPSLKVMSSGSLEPDSNFKITAETIAPSAISSIVTSLATSFSLSSAKVSAPPSPQQEVQQVETSEQKRDAKSPTLEPSKQISSPTASESRERLLLHYQPFPGHYEVLLHSEEFSQQNSAYQKSIILRDLEVIQNSISQVQKLCERLQQQQSTPQERGLRIESVKELSQILKPVDQYKLSNVFFRLNKELTFSQENYQYYVSLFVTSKSLLVWLGPEYLGYLQSIREDYVGIIENFLRPLLEMFSQSQPSHQSTDVDFVSILRRAHPSALAYYQQIGSSMLGSWRLNPAFSSFDACFKLCAKYDAASHLVPIPTSVPTAPTLPTATPGQSPSLPIAPSPTLAPTHVPAPTFSSSSVPQSLTPQTVTKPELGQLRDKEAPAPAAVTEVKLQREIKSEEKKLEPLVAEEELFSLTIEKLNSIAPETLQNRWKSILSSERAFIQIRNKTILPHCFAAFLQALSSFPPFPSSTNTNTDNYSFFDFGFVSQFSRGPTKPVNQNQPVDSLSVHMIEFMNCSFSEEVIVQMYHNFELRFPFKIFLVNCEFDCSWKPTSQIVNQQRELYYEIKVVKS